LFIIIDETEGVSGNGGSDVDENDSPSVVVIVDEEEVEQTQKG
jgi:hypothetical protein